MLTGSGSADAPALNPRQRSLSRVLVTTAAVLALASSLGAHGDSQSVPRFTATTIGGEKFTSGTLKGNVVLLQFWTTWCGVCRADQPVLDNIDEEFADRGLTVLAVNVRESKRTVMRYLDARPRSCKVVLTEDTNLTAIFPTRAVPYYVLIGRDGSIVTTQAGGGEAGLRQMLNRAFRTGPESMNEDTTRVMDADATAAGPSDGDLERPRIVRRIARAEPAVEPAVEPAPPLERLITVTGMLIRFDCLGEAARLHVAAARETFVLLIRQPDRVIVGGGGTRDLRCGSQKTAVSVHFAPGKDGKYGTSGDVRAIDFLNAP